MEANGHDLNTTQTDDETVADIKRLAAAQSTQALVEAVSDKLPPFDQRTHTLMLESADRIALDWIGQCKDSRENYSALEQMIVAQTAKVKEELTRLHLLGAQVLKETQRGKEVCENIGQQLDEIMERV